MTTATVWAGGGGAQIVNTILVLFNCNIDPWPQSHNLHTAAPFIQVTEADCTARASGYQWITVASCVHPREDYLFSGKRTLLIRRVICFKVLRN